MANYYKVLGVAEDADQEVIKAAYRALVKKFHPDHGGDPDVFKRINTAGNVLCDSAKRAHYDAWRAQRGTERQSSTPSRNDGSARTNSDAPSRPAAGSSEAVSPPMELSAGGCGLIALVVFALFAYFAITVFAKEFGWPKLALDLFVGVFAFLGAVNWSTLEGVSRKTISIYRSVSVTILCASTIYFCHGFGSTPWRTTTRAVPASQPKAAPTVARAEVPADKLYRIASEVGTDTKIEIIDSDSVWVTFKPGFSPEKVVQHTPTIAGMAVPKILSQLPHVNRVVVTGYTPYQHSDGKYGWDEVCTFAFFRKDVADVNWLNISPRNIAKLATVAQFNPEYVPR